MGRGSASSPGGQSARYGPDQPHAHHRESVAVEIAGVAHRHAVDLAIIDGAAERLAAEREIGAGRRQRRVERVERFVDRARAGRRGIARVEIEKQLRLERALAASPAWPLIGLRARIRAETAPAAAQPAPRSTVSCRREASAPAIGAGDRGEQGGEGGFAAHASLPSSRRARRQRRDDLVARLVEARAADRSAPGMVEPGMLDARARNASRRRRRRRAPAPCPAGFRAPRCGRRIPGSPHI